MISSSEMLCLHAYRKQGQRAPKKELEVARKIERGVVMKKKSLDQVLKKYSKNKEFKIAYEERRFYLQVAHLIRDLREKSGLSQADVAKKARVSQPMIARLERGDSRRTPTIETIQRILMVLGYKLVLEVKPAGAA
jgi:HTH-type transcriptional regulator / antitoxin HipB